MICSVCKNDYSESAYLDAEKQVREQCLKCHLDNIENEKLLKYERIDSFYHKYKHLITYNDDTLKKIELIINCCIDDALLDDKLIKEIFD